MTVGHNLLSASALTRYICCINLLKTTDMIAVVKFVVNILITVLF